MLFRSTNFGATAVTGGLSSSSTGAVTQTAATALTVTGAAGINAGANSITLAEAGNDFGGLVTLTGGTSAITDKNALTFGTLAVTGDLISSSVGAQSLGQGLISGALTAKSAGGAVSQTGALVVEKVATIDASAGSVRGAVTLDNAGNDFKGAVSSTGAVTSIRDFNQLTVSKIDAVGDTKLIGKTGIFGSEAFLLYTQKDRAYSINVAAGTVTLVTETGGIGNIGPTVGLPNFEPPRKNLGALSLSPTTTKVALEFPSGSIANFGVDTESQFRQITFTLTPAVASKQADVYACVFNSALCVNLDQSARILANASSSATINAALREMLLDAFGTDNLTQAIQKGYITKIGVVPPGIDEVEGAVGNFECKSELVGPAKIQSAKEC